MGKEGGREGGKEGGGVEAVKYVMYKHRSFSLTHKHTHTHSNTHTHSVLTTVTVPRENCELCMLACLLSYPHICPPPLPPPCPPHLCTETHRVEAQNIHHFISRLTAVRGLASCVNNSLTLTTSGLLLSDRPPFGFLSLCYASKMDAAVSAPSGEFLPCGSLFWVRV